MAMVTDVVVRVGEAEGALKTRKHWDFRGAFESFWLVVLALMLFPTYFVVITYLKYFGERAH